MKTISNKVYDEYYGLFQGYGVRQLSYYDWYEFSLKVKAGWELSANIVMIFKIKFKNGNSRFINR